MKIKVLHKAGFFSGCTVLLNNIIYVLNKYKKYPDEIEIDVLSKYNAKFEEYFVVNTSNLLKPTEDRIDFHHTYQFQPYNSLCFKELAPIIEHYFTPQECIKNIEKDMKIKYDIDFDNVCVLYFRGTDKQTETKRTSYDIYKQIAEKILEVQPNIRFLVQSEEQKFIEYFKNLYPNAIVFDEIESVQEKDEGKYEYSNQSLYKKEDASFFFAIVLIMSKCKYVVANLSNVSLWVSLYRKNSTNIIQILEEKHSKGKDLDWLPDYSLEISCL